MSRHRPPNKALEPTGAVLFRFLMFLVLSGLGRYPSRGQTPAAQLVR
jgi:hypothetical protein